MKSLLFLLLTATALSLNAQNIDTIHAGDGQLDLRYLPLGTQRYLVYIKTKEGQKKNIWLWERTTTKEKWDNMDAIVIRQQWVTSDTGRNRREVTSAVLPTTFTPVYHSTQNPNAGTGQVYNVNSSEFFAVDPVANAMWKKNNQGYIVTTFNWELDLETFALLPLQEEKTFVINFFQSGQLPGWYNYTVTGSEKISTVNGEMIDCFKLYIDYGKDLGNSTWWLSKKTHEVLKMEEHYNNMTRYKIKLSVQE